VNEKSRNNNIGNISTMRRFNCLTVLILVIITCSVNGQTDQGNIKGEIRDESDNTVTNATVAVYDSLNEGLITGDVSDQDGTFEISIDPGTYLLKITYLSFEPFEKDIRIESGETNNLGVVRMNGKIEDLDEVVIRGERSQMELNFDRRVFNVGQDITSLGGSALDVLDNVPSISIDIDGNVSLRGNQSVRILINGKPSNLVSDDADALRSFSADMIEEVEIITNPSSKYAAEGSAGIINIKLKKQRNQGLNGNVSAGGGLPDQLEGSTNFNYRTGSVNWFFNGGVDYESEPESGSSFQRFAGPDTTYMFREQSDETESEIDGNIRFGADIFFTENQKFTLSSTIDVEEETNTEEITFTDMEFIPEATSGDIIRRLRRDNVETENELDLEFDLDYEIKFDGDEHMFTTDSRFDISGENSNTDINETMLQGSGNPLLQRSADDENEKDFRFNAEYIRPLGSGGKFEAGFRSDTEWMNTTDIAETFVDGIWVGEPAFNNNFLYVRV